ncbi:MAG: alpha-glucan family phosphorylase, partial [Bacteroidota bacterium]
MPNNLLKPDYLFEVSWEVCNKVGGIHTVISTKAVTLENEMQDNFILIGPDVWRDEKENSEFVEDIDLLRSWREYALTEGIRIRVGRWNIVSSPLVVIVDFTPYISQRDQVFSKFWEEYKLDSLQGQWDYVEPALFGYAAGKVIESYCRYYLSIRENVVAQFHEWMTGTGALYLNDSFPIVATCFTTHATVIGRCLAGNGWPLYDKLNEYNGDLMAREFNVISKQSLEKISAKYADAFTTVSDITAKECIQFLEKAVDIVTPNGFEDTFIPENEHFEEKRMKANKKLTQIANILLDQETSDDSIFIATSGRYEYKNKGIDLFIDALGNLNNSPDLKRDIVAFLMIPANNYGPRKVMLNNIAKCHSDENFDNRILTHNLHDAELDPILNQLKKWNLDNRKENKVKVIFVPSYLNGNDGIFDMKYYDLLIGMDLTVFASYYEPWGYTPLESLAFHVPTITTTLAGFGKWVNTEMHEKKDAVVVLFRGESNNEDVVKGIVDKIISCSTKDINEKSRIKQEAFEISRIALWKNLIDNYRKAYSIAIKKLLERKEKYADLLPVESSPRVLKSEFDKPAWKRILIHSALPEKFTGLTEIAGNIWWTWNYRAIELFKLINVDLWREKRYNPIALLEDVSINRFDELAKDKNFVNKYESVYKEYKDYMKEKENQTSPKVAYFSMEFGFHDNLKIFSGGLGILAGDYMKEASDSNVDMIGFGLLYRYGYFKQTLTIAGEQQATYEPQKFSHLPVSPLKKKDGDWLIVSILFPGRTVHARVWEVKVGRNILYLLDTDFDENIEQDRSITHQLYGGDSENRLKQEMLLGIGGIRVINLLEIKPDLYHCNEGHAAFIGLERLRVLRTKRNLTFTEALEIIKASTLFTTHTPVPAGHDTFEENLMRTYMAHYPSRLKISWEDLMNMGKANATDIKFSMSYLAANLSQEINGVSWLHGEVTKKMFNKLWDGFYPEESHIGHVTNGVHYATWTAKAWKRLHEDVFGNKFIDDMSDKSIWAKIYDVDDEDIWKIRQNQRRKLVEYVKKRVHEHWIRRYENPKNTIKVINNINEDTLTIGFARRFATYKRAHLLFSNLDRLSEILNNKERPVQLLYAGKAHPNDKAGQDLIKNIVEISKSHEFLGKIIFLENYDIELARKLVQGVDIWLNTPTRPLEASGTSGMKAVLNGALHFSVLDGW